MYQAFIVKVSDLRPHTNADRLQIASFFGNDTCVGLDVKIGDIGIYFPSDGQLSVEFCQVHDLVRRKDENGNPAGGYLDPDKRNIKAVKLRGEKSDGLYMPISCLEYTGLDVEGDIEPGPLSTVINGHEIYQKYIPKTQHRVGNVTAGNRTRKKHAPIAPLFSEHADTEQLAYNLGAFKSGDEIEITLKMHGTSQRTGYLPTLKGYKRTLWDRITRKEGTPIYDWGGVSGTRRVVLENYDGGFYGSNEFREQHSKKFEGKLHKGETVYYEVVGFTHTGASIMGECSNKKLNDKEFVKQYGETTVFSYGCEPVVSIDCDDVQSDIYVYRMTMTNEDGFVVEYTPDFMRYRCEQMGVKTVPVLWKGTIPENPASAEDATITPGEWIMNVAERFYDGPDPIGKTHIREGVVVRILNRPKFAAFKHKNFAFKVLEGIIKETAEAPDMEEAQDVEDSSN
jgi:hypothetical protein